MPHAPTLAEAGAVAVKSAAVWRGGGWGREERRDGNAKRKLDSRRRDPCIRILKSGLLLSIHRRDDAIDCCSRSIGSVVILFYVPRTGIVEVG